MWGILNESRGKTKAKHGNTKRWKAYGVLNGFS